MGWKTKVEITRLRRAAGRTLEDDFHVSSDKCLTRCEDAIEQVKEALALNLRNRLANG
jgi:hypothetical protein